MKSKLPLLVLVLIPIPGLPGQFNDSNRLKANSFANTVYEQRELDGGWGAPQPDMLQFISNNKVVFSGNLPGYYILGNQDRRIRSFDTLSYIIRGDTMFLENTINKTFLGRQKMEIVKNKSIFLNLIEFHPNRNLPKRLMEKIKVKEDTIHNNISIEPLLFRHLQKPWISVYVNGELQYKKPALPDNQLLLEGNFVQDISDTTRLKVVFSYVKDEKTKSIQKTFIVKGYGVMRLPVEIRYKEEFSVCPHKYLIIKDGKLYYLPEGTKEINEYYVFLKKG